MFNNPGGLMGPFIIPRASARCPYIQGGPTVASNGSPSPESLPQRASTLQAFSSQID